MQKAIQLLCLSILLAISIPEGSSRSTTHETKSFNILILLPAMRGHRTPVLNLGKFLKDAGHSITAFTFTNEGETTEANGENGAEEARRAGFRVIEAGESLESIDTNQINHSFFEKLNKAPKFFANMNMLAYNGIMSFYQNTSEPKPDVIIYEIFVMIGASIAKAFDVPGVLVLPGHHTITKHTLLNTPWLFMPKYRQAPPLHLRLINAMSNLAAPFFWKWVQHTTDNELPPTRDSSEWPLTIDQSLNEGHLVLVIPVAPVVPPQPLSPLIQLVGPILHSTGSSSNVIPQKLKDWLDSAADSNEPVVFVSFGSIWTPEKDTLLNLTQGLNSFVESGSYRVLWARGASAFRKNNVEIPKNISGKFFIEDFVPQQAVLPYRKSIKAFVSHCGSGSTMESLYNGIPLIALPLGIDQYVTAGRLEEAGLAIAMDSTSLVPQELEINLKRLIHESGFAHAIKQQRAILELAGGGPRAVELVEAIAESGNLVLLRPFDADWPWYSSLSLDILAAAYVLIVGAIAVFWLFVLLIVYLCRFCCSRKKIKPKLE